MLNPSKLRIVMKLKMSNHIKLLFPGNLVHVLCRLVILIFQMYSFCQADKMLSPNLG